jgi:hypothetical protein
MTVNKKPDRNIPFFEKIGGWKRIVKYANESDENFAKVLTIFGKQLLEAGSTPVNKDDRQAVDNFVHLFESVVQARINHALGQRATITSVTDDASGDVQKMGRPDISNAGASQSKPIADSTGKSKLKKPLRRSHFFARSPMMEKQIVRQRTIRSDVTSPQRRAASRLFPVCMRASCWM